MSEGRSPFKSKFSFTDIEGIPQVTRFWTLHSALRQLISYAFIRYGEQKVRDIIESQMNKARASHEAWKRIQENKNETV